MILDSVGVHDVINMRSFFSTEEVDFFLSKYKNNESYPFTRTMSYAQELGKIVEADPKEQILVSKSLPLDPIDHFALKLVYAGVHINEKVFEQKHHIQSYIPSSIALLQYSGEEKSHVNIHCDDETLTRRKMTMVVCMTEPTDYEGGELLVFENRWRKGKTLIDQRKGDVVVFTPNVYHQVLPVTRGIRHSVVSWIL